MVLITGGTSGFGLKTAQRFKQAGDNFDDFSVIGFEDSVDSEGRLVRTTKYNAIRKFKNLIEYYDVVNVATYKSIYWDEKVSISLRESDYSNLIGTWECTIGNEFIRLEILDMYVVDGTSITIRYKYETSPWNNQEVASDEIIEEENLRQAYFSYNEKNTTMYYHDYLIATLELNLGSTNEYASVCIYKGSVYLDYYQINNNGRIEGDYEDYDFKKIY